MKWLLAELRSLANIYVVVLVLMIVAKLVWMVGVELHDTNPAAFLIVLQAVGMILVAVVVKFGLKIVFGGWR